MAKTSNPCIKCESALKRKDMKCQKYCERYEFFINPKYKDMVVDFEENRKRVAKSVEKNNEFWGKEGDSENWTAEQKRRRKGFQKTMEQIRKRAGHKNTWVWKVFDLAKINK